MEDSARGLTGRPARASVSDVVEDEVLPRLYASHQNDPDAGITNGLPERCSNPEAVRTLAEFVVAYDLSKAEALICARRADGVAPDVLLIDYLAPAARFLGDLWVKDQLDFTSVTIGVGRLQELSYALSRDMEQQRQEALNSRRALLAPAPGDQHTFGVSIVASFMRRDGWDVAGGPATTEAGLIERVRAERFDVLGLALGAERWSQDLDATIDRIRSASRNQDIAVLLGGPLPLTLGLKASDVGADALVLDARQASAVAQSVMRNVQVLED